MNEVNTLILETNNLLIDLGFIQPPAIALSRRSNCDLTDRYNELGGSDIGTTKPDLLFQSLSLDLTVLSITLKFPCFFGVKYKTTVIDDVVLD